MADPEARQFFLDRIAQQLRDEGRPLDGLELQYWKALLPQAEPEVQGMWKDSSTRRVLATADKKFEAALHDAIAHDLVVSPAAAVQYLKKLDEIKSVDGVQLQALVFAAATKFKELTPSYPLWVRLLISVAILAMLGIGLWIGIHLRR